MKKTVRQYTHIDSIRDLFALLAPRGERTLFRYPEGKEFVRVSYAEFSDTVSREAAGLCAMGLGSARVAVIGDNSAAWLSSYLAVILSGGIVVPMDKELASAEMRGFLEIAGVSAVVCDKNRLPAFLAMLDEGHPTLKTVIPTCPCDEREGVLPLSDLVARGGEHLPFTPVPRDPDAPAEMLFTSGTTGTSKCVVLSEKNVTSTVNSACETVEIYPDDVALSLLPYHHTYELAIALGELNYGMEVGINDSLRHITRNLAEIRPTALILVPLIVSALQKKIVTEIDKKGKTKAFRRAARLSNFLRHLGIDLRRKFFGEVTASLGGRLTRMIVGGAALNPELIKFFDTVGIRISQGYGITECSPLIAVDPYYKSKPGTVGTAVPSCTVKIVDGTPNEKGVVEGEIAVKGDNVMLGYYNNPEATAAVMTEDGWFLTGDVGTMDHDGYITITGRKKSVIVLENGKNVFPEEIEEYLASVPGVGETVVVGRLAADGETVEVTALVYPDPEIFPEGTDKAEIQKALDAAVLELNKKLPTFKAIRRVELRDTPFEKTTSRKIKRHLVK